MKKKLFLPILFIISLIFMGKTFAYVYVSEQKYYSENADEIENKYIPIYSIYLIKNTGSSDETVNITIPLDSSVEEAKVCNGNYYEEGKTMKKDENDIYCYSSSDEISSTFNSSSKTISFSITIPANSEKYVTIIQRTGKIDFIKYLFRTEKINDKYKDIIYVINPLNKDLKNKYIIIPDELVKVSNSIPCSLPSNGNESYCYGLVKILNGNNEIPIYIKIINANNKIFYKIPVCSLDGESCKTDSDGNIIFDSYDNIKFIFVVNKVLPFNRNYWFTEYFSPVSGFFYVYRITSDLADKNDIYALNEPLKDLKSYVNDITVKDDGIQKKVKIKYKIYRTINNLFKFEKDKKTYNFDIEWRKWINLTFTKMDDSTFQTECGKSFTEAGIETNSGSVYVYKGDMDDLNKTHCWMVLEDKDSANDFNTLLFDVNGNSIYNETDDRIFSVEENETDQEIILDRGNIYKYSYRIQNIPNIDGTESEINITFTRTQTFLSGDGSPLYLINTTEQNLFINKDNDFIVLINKNNELYYSLKYNLSDGLDILDTINDSDITSINAGDEIYSNGNSSFIVNGYSYNTKDFNVTYKSVLREEIPYFGKIYYYDNIKNDYVLEDAVLLNNKIYRYKTPSDKFYLSNENLELVASDDEYKLVDNILMYYNIISLDEDSYIVEIDSADTKLFSYKINVDTSIINESSSTYFSTSLRKDVYERKINLISTVPSEIDEIITVPFTPESYYCIKNGNLISLERLSNTEYRLLTDINKGENNIICKFLKDSSNSVTLVDQSSDLTENGKTSTTILYLNVNNPERVRIEIPIKVNEIPEKVCLNDEVNSDCDLELDIDAFKYEDKGTYLEAYYDIYLSDSKYLKFVTKTLVNPIDYKIEKNIEIRKNKTVSKATLIIENNINKDLPYSQLTLYLQSMPIQILEYNSGEVKDVTSSVIVNKVGTGYQYVFRFSDYIPYLLKGIKKDDYRRFIIYLDTRNIEVSYLKGGVSGGEFNENVYTIEKEIKNNENEGFNIRLFFDEEPLYFIKKYFVYIKENDTMFKINGTEESSSIVIDDDIGGKETKIYGLKYIKSNQYYDDLLDQVYTDLNIIFDSNLRDKINEFASKRADKYLEKGENYIKKIDDEINKIVELIIKNKKDNINETEARNLFNNIGKAENFVWDDILDSKDFFIDYSDYQRIKDIKEDLIKDISDFLKYVDDVGKIDEVLDKLKECLPLHVDERNYCYEKYELTNNEISKLESCLKNNNYLDDNELSDEELNNCLEELTKNIVQITTEQQENESNENNQQEQENNEIIQSLKNQINQLITDIAMRVSELKTKINELEDSDKNLIDNIELDIQNIKENLNNENNQNNLELIKTKLEGYLNQLNNIKPNPIIPKKNKLREKIENVVEQLDQEYSIATSEISDEDLINVEVSLQQKYKEKENELQEIIDKINNLKKRLSDAKTQDEIDEIENKLNEYKNQFENKKKELLNVINEIKNKLQQKTSEEKKKETVEKKTIKSEETKTEEKKEGNNNILLFGIVLLILISIGSAIGYYYYNKKKKENEKGGDKKDDNKDNQNKRESLFTKFFNKKKEEVKEEIKQEEKKEEEKPSILEGLFSTETEEKFEKKQTPEQSLESVNIIEETPKLEENIITIEDKEEEVIQNENPNIEEKVDIKNEKEESEKISEEKDIDEKEKKLEEIKEKLKNYF